VIRSKSRRPGDGLAARVALAGPARRSPFLLDDVGDGWRALLIGAPPARSSF
jgi:hypothetical protein